MAATPEALVKKRIRKILDAHGVYYAMPIGTGYGNSGTPDFLCCVNGFFLAIEAKAGKGKTTALQDDHIRRIMENRGAVRIIRETNIEELEAIILFLEGVNNESKTY